MTPQSNSQFSHLREYIRIAREKANEGHLSVPRQITEMILLYLCRGLGPRYYLFGRFWRREIPLGKKLRHLNEKDYVRQIAKLNSPQYQKCSQHKVAEKAILSLFGIPTPRFFGHIQNLTGRSCHGDPLRTAEDLAALLERERPTRICFKLVEGWSGTGFEAAEIDYNGSPPALIPLPTGSRTDIGDYLDIRLKMESCPQGRIIEEYCRQDPWYQSLNPTSLNTLRIYAILQPSGPARILGGYLRIGRKGSLIDNASKGGILFPFDPKSGTLKLGHFNTIDTSFYKCHPDSGIQIEGCKLPKWDEALELVRKALEIFPNIRFAGLDIAVTEDGPTVIELNVQPDRNAACNIDLPTLDMLTP